MAPDVAWTDADSATGGSTTMVATGARDDAMAMRYLVPGWTYDAKKPSLGR